MGSDCIRCPFFEACLSGPQRKDYQQFCFKKHTVTSGSRLWVDDEAIKKLIRAHPN